MKTKPLCTLLVVALVATGVITGCETGGRSAGLGAVLGGAAGYAIGGEKGALIGAAVGGVAGWGIYKAKERRVKTAQQTVEEYEYEPTQGLKVDLRPTTSVSPTTVARGKTLEAELEYALLGAGDSGVPVMEKQVIQQDGQEVATLRNETVTREDGTWNIITPIEVTDEVAPGNYEVVQSITVGDENYVRRTPISVLEAQATLVGPDSDGPSEFSVAAR